MPHGGESKGGPVGFPTLNLEDTLAKLSAGPGFNTDVKSVGPDGTINLHSDTPTMQMMLEQALAAQPAAPPVGAGGPQVGEPQQQGQQGFDGLFGEEGLFGQPGFISELGKLGTVISGGPNTFGGQLGQFATESAESQLFNRFLQNLLQQGGGQNPSLPSSSDLGFLGVEGLSPERQLQAFGASQQQQQLNTQSQRAQLETLLGLRSLQTTSINEVFTQARTLALLSPDPPDAEGRKTIRLGVKPDGTPMPAGQDYAYLVNPETGDVIPIGPGKKPVPGAAGVKPSTKTDLRRDIQIGILSQMPEAIQAGLDAGARIIDPDTGKQILDVGRILKLLRDPAGKVDINAIIFAISQVPEASAEYDLRFEESLAKLDAGVSLGRVLREVRNLPKVNADKLKTIGGLGASK